MGFLDALFGRTTCPDCGGKGARKSGDRIRCLNPSCRHFDASLGRGGRLLCACGGAARRSDFWPERPLTIHYRNFRGQEKSFTADEESIARKHNHIVARVVPTGEKIALSRDRIQNLAEVDQAVARRRKPQTPGPTARERQ